jgi:transposase, IS30 family
MTYHQLTQEERYRITAHRMAGNSLAQIARLLQRHPSTIGRELRRNATRHDETTALLASTETTFQTVRPR